ncbi:MAG: hypothetical protein NTW21_16515 [Verrucomicrobia bacterium]|nr:hypothetical protein [Verrucomicrobiota bacterium]
MSSKTSTTSTTETDERIRQRLEMFKILLKQWTTPRKSRAKKS